MVPENEEGAETRRCGFVALVGRPNVGKSTLLNQLLGMKLSIVSRRPQTTRHRILGVHTEADAQFVYVDTPGLHRNEKRALNRQMNLAARSALADVDAIVMVVEPGRWTDEDDLVLKEVRRAGRPTVAVVNKVDLVRQKEELLPFLEELAGRHDFAAIIPLSAERGTNVEPLQAELRRWLPESPFLFPEEQVTDRSERFLVGELVREQLMRTLGQEVPYSTSVEVERFDEKGRVTHIHALIWVERGGQKAIVIGDGGKQLRQIGQNARRQIERLLGRQVNLQLWVKVRAGWSDDERALQSLGYDDFSSVDEP